MANKMFLAGVGIAEYFNTGTAQKIFTAKTLIESSISIGITEEEVRGGKGNGLIGKYFHTSTFGLTMLDALFDLNYLSLKVGGTVQVGGDTLTKEKVIVGAGGSITVTGTPKAFLGGIYGWYGDEQRLTFTGKTGVVSGYSEGDSVEIQYYANNEALRELTIPADFIPAEGYMVLTGTLYNGDPKNVSGSSRVGELVIEIPRFQMGGATDLAMTSTGASQTTLDGSALMSFDDNNSDGYYAKIKEVRVDAKFYDGMIGLGIDSSDTIQTGDQLFVYGIYKNAASKLLSADKLTFTGADATGKVTASSDGEITVKLKDVTEEPYVNLIAEATVV